MQPLLVQIAQSLLNCSSGLSRKSMQHRWQVPPHYSLPDRSTHTCHVHSSQLGVSKR